MMNDAISRRSFLKIAGVAGSLLATEACRPGNNELIPYLVPEQNVIPGVPVFYRTACRECESGCSVIARVREGRVIKLEGNPDSPINAGALCARGQAALQGLYNPDRLPEPQVRVHGKLQSIKWDEGLRILSTKCQQASSHSNEVVFLGNNRGPSFHKVVLSFLQQFSSNKFFYYNPLIESAAIKASQACFGRADLPSYRLDRAEVLISFGADFLETWRSPVEFSRQYADFRRPMVKSSNGRVIGLAYYVGPRMSLTAAKTDQFYACRPGAEAMIALAILRAMADQGLVKNASDTNRLKQFLAPFDPPTVADRTGITVQAINRIAKEFGTAPSAIALAGGDDFNIHVATNVINAVTGNLNSTVWFPQGLTEEPNEVGQSDLEPLVQAMRQEKVKVLIVAGGNPVFTMSSDLQFTEALKHVPMIVWLGGVPDETAEFAHLQLPIHHPLEDWTDSATPSGVFTLGQPTMVPVFDSKSIGDVLLDTIKGAGANPSWPDLHSVVEQDWRGLGERLAPSKSFEEFWTDVRHRGGLFMQPPAATTQLKQSILDKPLTITPANPKQISLYVYPHIFFYDGRGADKPWLQENPEPVSQVVWDSWLQIHPELASTIGVRDNDIVEVSSTFGSIEIAAKLDTGVQPDTVAIPLGQGHKAYGRYARGRGANPWPILAPDNHAVPVQLRRADKTYEIVTALYTPDMMDRPIVEKISVEEFEAGKRPPPHEPPPPEPYEMFPGRVFPQHDWGMTIDVNACTGCGACVTACYAENNLNVVGKAGVRNGRIMSWLRLESYFPKDLDAPQILIEPMLCQQCSNAPCEPVCPVYASYHTDEGLNAQIYNRCVGTRYCENNCPYKVRRFNWYKPEFAETLQLQLNPDVTVRSGGVMEKCTFCVQRIRSAEITADIEDRQVRDGDIIPACAQTCPSQAIIFGDIKDGKSKMMRARADNAIRTYRVLEQLNTKPSITYLRAIYRKREV